MWCMAGGRGRKEKERIMDVSKVLAQAIERIESPSTKIGKTTVGRVLGRKIRSSVLEVKWRYH